jgi:hypothetical protein
MKNTRQRNILYAAAAIPALYLPFSYIVMAIWIFISVGRSSDDPNFVRSICNVGMYLTFIQWPFYLVWAACSRELTIRLRVLWMVVLFLLNMFAMPWFLYCKYKGTTQTAFLRKKKN